MIRAVVLIALTLLASCGVAVPADAAHNPRLRLRLVHDSASVLYFRQITANSCTAPSTAYQHATSHFTASEKASGNWTYDDARYFTIGADQCTAQINLRRPWLYNLTFSGSCVFSSTTGLSGDSTTCHGVGGDISTLANFKQNNAHSDAWALNASTNVLGQVGGSSNALSMTYSAGSNLRRLTGTTAVTDTPGITGYQYIDRIASSSVVTTGTNDTVQSSGIANASTTIPSVNFAVCSRASGFCTSTAQLLTVGIGAPPADETARYNHLRTFFQSLGVAVP